MMKRIVTLALAFSFFVNVASAQILKNILNKTTTKDSAGNIKINKPSTWVSGGTSSLSNDDIINGLKEALKVGTENSSQKLSKLNGFFGDAAIKILMPAEAKKVETTLRSFGMGKLVDNAILSMNRAAEDAAKDVAPIFWNSIRQMSITDGFNILKGGDFAATDYLKKMTTAQLTEKFRPVIETSLAKVNATKYWKDLFTAYNRFSKEPINTDLTAFVTERSLSGLFYNVGLEEQKIRKDPAAQVTDLLKKVFGKS